MVEMCQNFCRHILFSSFWKKNISFFFRESTALLQRFYYLLWLLRPKCKACLKDIGLLHKPQSNDNLYFLDNENKDFLISLNLVSRYNKKVLVFHGGVKNPFLWKIVTVKYSCGVLFRFIFAQFYNDIEEGFSPIYNWIKKVTRSNTYVFSPSFFRNKNVCQICLIEVRKLSQCHTLFI